MVSELFEQQEAYAQILEWFNDGNSIQYRGASYQFEDFKTFLELQDLDTLGDIYTEVPELFRPVMKDYMKKRMFGYLGL